jgi:glycosyltransferase involved in cell wall biosynthesis
MRDTVSAVIPVYRDAAGAANVARGLLEQRLPAGMSLEVIVVDDGSDDGTSSRLREFLSPAVRLLELRENRGRSAARQEGIAACTGSAVVFLDCDCEPTDREFIFRHWSALASGAVASVGPVIGLGNGFWDRYQRAASTRRRKMFDRGIPYVGSSVNMMLRTAVLREAGGFDTRYRHYGFEDRDLLIRIARLGRVAWCDDAQIRHLDRITMASVAQKMRAAGTHTSRLFASQYPAEYAALGYASIDANERAWLRPAARVLGGLPSLMARAFDGLERRRLLPWPVGFALVRIISAASYTIGTADSGQRRSIGEEAQPGHDQ